MQDELDFVQSYISLESGRIGEGFTASVIVEEGLDAKRIMIPSMIVQIPVENAIKHGLAGKMEKRSCLSVFPVKEKESVSWFVTMDEGIFRKLFLRLKGREPD